MKIWTRGTFGRWFLWSRRNNGKKKKHMQRSTCHWITADVRANRTIQREPHSTTDEEHWDWNSSRFWHGDSLSLPFAWLTFLLSSLLLRTVHLTKSNGLGAGSIRKEFRVKEQSKTRSVPTANSRNRSRIAAFTLFDYQQACNFPAASSKALSERECNRVIASVMEKRFTAR